MKKLFKYLKDYKLYIFFIVILLALQAYSELSRRRIHRIL